METRDVEFEACLTEPTVLAYLDAELDPAQRAEVESHLDDCSVCLDLMATLGRTVRVEARSKLEPSPPPSGAERYELRHEIATGGMGRVLEAWDRVLEREVAIKMMRTQDAATARQRFEREMTLTARLQHPAIIAIHDAGVLDDGSPFYAMSMVRGRTLETCIEQAHTPTERVALIPGLEQLIDAMAYAHAQGVIHRDLKPHNVLVGPFGETVLLDWGLAKVLEEPEPAHRDTLPNTEPDPPDSGSPTRAGQVLGTVGYIAPEVQRGAPATKRSDVYALGVILARVLGGTRPPELDSAPPRLDDVPRGVPEDLVAIARRALLDDPNARYADASELSADLRRFSAGQMVSAREYSALDQLKRFARRHRAAVAVGTIAGALLLSGGAIAARSLVRAEAQAQAERDVALEGREAAEGLIDFTLRDLRERLNILGRIDLLQDVALHVGRYYQQVEVRDGADGAKDLSRRGEALEISGRARLDTGMVEESLEDFRAAAAAFTEARARVDGTEIRTQLARNQLFVSLAHSRLGQLEPAREQAQTARDLISTALAEDPECLECRELLGALSNHSGRLHQAVGETDQATADFERGRASASELPRDSKNRARVIVEATTQLGMASLIQGDLQTASLEFAKAVAEARDGLALWPDNPVPRYELGYALHHQGTVLLELGQNELAQSVLEEALHHYQALERLDTNNMAYTASVSLVQGLMADLLSNQGRFAEAVEQQRASVATNRRIYQRDPEQVIAHFNLGVALSNLATTERALGNMDVAATTGDEAVEHLRATSARVPTDPMLRQGLAASLLDRGLTSVARSRRGDARRYLEEALALKAADLEDDVEALRRAIAGSPPAP